MIGGGPFTSEADYVVFVAQGGTLAPAGDPLLARCRQTEGRVGRINDTSGHNLIVGSDGADAFGGRLTYEPVLICGSGAVMAMTRNNSLVSAATCYGGVGNDTVAWANGHFFGGTGNDSVENLTGGTFYGGPGSDSYGSLPPPGRFIDE